MAGINAITARAHGMTCLCHASLLHLGQALKRKKSVAGVEGLRLARLQGGYKQS
jgi:hypothetical protein